MVSADVLTVFGVERWESGSRPVGSAAALGFSRPFRTRGDSLFAAMVELYVEESSESVLVIPRLRDSYEVTLKIFNLRDVIVRDEGKPNVIDTFLGKSD